MIEVELKDNERIDDLQIKGYKLIQNREGFCFGMDAVLLSDYARIRKGSRVMDLCSGTGIIPVLLAAKYEPAGIVGMEIQADYVEMAGRSVRMNGLQEIIRMEEGNVCQVPDNYPSNSFDFVTCNPPYMTGNHGLSNKNRNMALARHEILCTLDDVVSAAAWLLKAGGHFVMVHRPFRLAEIIACLKAHKLEPKRMRLVYPYVDKEPNMVLIDSAKGGRQRITVDPPLIVYHQDGTYTEEIYRIYGMNQTREASGPWDQTRP